MKLESKRTVDGGMIHYFGPFDNKDVVLLMGRDNFRKDDILIESLIQSLRKEKYTVMWYEHAGVSISRALEDRYRAHFPWAAGESLSERIFRKICKALILLPHPSDWGYFSKKSFLRKHEGITLRSKNLREVIRSLGPNRNIYILSRSSGGRVATLIEDEPMIKKIICISYPFRHPESPIEPERFKHLETLRKPFLIIQGDKDQYGGRELVGTYLLSSAVVVDFVHADHDFMVSKDEWRRVMDRIETFIEKT